MRDSPYRLTEKKKTAGRSRRHASTPRLSFRPASLPPSDLESYSDKYRQSQALAASSLNAEQLGLDKSFFPERVWTAYFERKIVDAKRVKKRKRVEDGDDDAGDADVSMPSPYALSLGRLMQSTPSMPCSPRPGLLRRIRRGRRRRSGRLRL